MEISGPGRPRLCVLSFGRPGATTTPGGEQGEIMARGWLRTVAAVALWAGVLTSWETAGTAEQAAVGGPDVPGRRHLAPGVPQPLGHGLGHRRLRRRQGPRLDQPPARDAHRRGALRRADPADGHLLQGGAGGHRARPERQGRAGLGRQGQGRPGQLAAQPARHLRRPHRPRLGRHPHAPPGDEVHPRGQAGADRRRSTTRTTAATTRRCSAARRASGSIRRPTRRSSPTATATAG